MDNLNGVVNQYLTTNTSYALLISGKWGVGKTYYFNKTLSPAISETPTYNNAKKKYRPIRISLFGLKSIEEIQAEIFLSLYSIFKNPKLQLGAEIFKVLTKGLISLNGLGAFGEVIENLSAKKIGAAIIDIQEIVFCFDDLERISPNLEFEELIGYINTLVETENVKVLIIANEGKVIKENYSSLREKVIGTVIEFIPNISKTYDEIIQDKFSAFTLYKSYLEKNRVEVLETFSRNSENLRILNFALTRFQLIFSEIEINITAGTKLAELKKEILGLALKFTIAISIEYRENRISFSERKELNTFRGYARDLLNSLKVANSSNKPNNNEPKSYRSCFWDTYYSSEEMYYFFKSIYDYLTGGAIFNYSEFLKDIEGLYHLTENNTISPENEVFNKLNFNAFYQLTDFEYIELTKTLLSYAYNGDYGLGQYTSVFYFATRLNNPLRLNLDRLEKNIISGMKKGKTRYAYTNALQTYLEIPPNSLHYQHLIKIKEVAIKINQSILNKKAIDDSRELEKLFYANFPEFYQKVTATNNEYTFKAIFNEFDKIRFISFLKSATPDIRFEMLKIFEVRYQYINEPHKEELPFLIRLRKHLQAQRRKLKDQNVSGFIYNSLDRIVGNVIKNIESLPS